MTSKPAILTGELSIADMFRIAAERISNAGRILNGPSSIDTPVASGITLEQEVQPGLHATAHDLTWLVDGDFESSTGRMFHCDILVAGECCPLHVRGHPPVSYHLNRAVVTGFGEPMSCSRPWRAGTRSRGVGFVMAPDFLDRFGEAVEDDGLSILHDFLRPGFRAVELPASTSLSRFAGRVLDNPYTGRMAELFAETNTLSFLLETTKLLQEEERLVRQIGRWHYQRVCEAREILDASLVDPPGTLDLARLVGVNLTTLQQNFRAAFGTTIFGYVRTQRLKIGRILIVEHGLGVAEAGYRVGFTNAAAFTAAYRRNFGHPPSAERGTRR